MLTVYEDKSYIVFLDGKQKPQHLLFHHHPIEKQVSTFLAKYNISGVLLKGEENRSFKAWIAENRENLDRIIDYCGDEPEFAIPITISRKIGTPC